MAFAAPRVSSRGDKKVYKCSEKQRADVAEHQPRIFRPVNGTVKRKDLRPCTTSYDTRRTRWPFAIQRYRRQLRVLRDGNRPHREGDFVATAQPSSPKILHRNSSQQDARYSGSAVMLEPRSD